MHAGVFTDRVNDVCGDATRHCDLPHSVEEEVLDCQTNKHEETAFAIAIQGAEGHETSCDYTRQKN